VEKERLWLLVERERTSSTCSQFSAIYTYSLGFTNGQKRSIIKDSLPFAFKFSLNVRYKDEHFDY
jgi:hypothetical protein